MDTVTLYVAGNVTGMTPEQLGKMHIDFGRYDIVRRVERWSIREFMRENQHWLRGRVLDYGAGEEPYRHFVVGEYIPFAPDRSGHTLSYLMDKCEPSSVNCVMCNQVMQYVSEPKDELRNFMQLLRPLGSLVMTFPTNWDEVEDNDLHRFTAAGMRALLTDAGFNILKMERRAQVQMHNFKFPLGYGVVAVKP